ncbi:FG-GAP repeat domain-containing protein [Phnomibacter ginsenosidimutans]|uniref:VCBS repeat-containing protein n=1 Tax=Phnomibacter ginsenosidimutans TaxID=2676868 RepID=A0A6I6GW17_9BACT|nr:VCBS repeat-containing protein [Phnomibacter ginsenosidimutans]QGW29309.1 VCBS repeat-containing protein [Phnomibacter ginsenosidimutans]
MKTRLLSLLFALCFTTALSAQPFSKMLLDTISILPASDSDYVFFTADYDHDRISDLWVVKTRNTGSKMTELHILDGASKFQKFSLQTATSLPLSGNDFDFGAGDFDRDNVLDLYCIKKKNTATNSAEVHILNGASKYQFYLVQTGTPVPAGPDHAFFVKDMDNNQIPDLYCVKTYNTGSLKNEVHVLNGLTKYTKFMLQTATVLKLNARDFTYIAEDYEWDGFVDLFAVQTAGTASNFTEVHLLNGRFNYTGFRLQTATALPLIDKSENIVLTGDIDTDDARDLIVLKYRNTQSGKVEIKVAGFQKKPKEPKKKKEDKD